MSSFAFQPEHMKGMLETPWELAAPAFRVFGNLYFVGNQDGASWLLDTSLKQLLGETSNIIRFQNMFAVLYEEKSDAILRYVFRWDCTREMLPQMPCSSGFAKKVKELTLAGQEFHVSYGVIR